MIILLGKPGTGKSTQSKLLAKAKNYYWISTGEILRNSLTGMQLEQTEKGHLLPDSEMIKALSPALEKIAKEREFILDGFPRTIPQAEWLIKEAKSGRLQLAALINLEIPDEAAKERLSKRGRIDDTQEVLNERFRTYNRLTAPMIELFKQSGLPMFDIDANQAPDKVQEDIIEAQNKTTS